jgi:tripartite-type tricarboxylate transporter receptor subunit TctC
MLDLQRREKIKLTHIPFMSTGECFSALLGGHVDMAGTFGSAGNLTSGTIRALATMERERYEDYPDVPTMLELGFPIALSSTYGLFTAKGTPKEIMDKLSKGAQEILKANEQNLIGPLKKLEMRPFIRGPEEFSKQVAANEKYFREVWGDLKWE